MNKVWHHKSPWHTVGSYYCWSQVVFTPEHTKCKMQPILQFLSARTVLAVKDLNHQLHMYIKHHIPIWMRLFLVIGSMLQNPKKNLWWIKFWPTWIICKTWWIQCSQTCRSWLGPPCTFHPLRHLWTWARNSAGTASSAFSDGGSFKTSLQR